MFNLFSLRELGFIVLFFLQGAAIIFLAIRCRKYRLLSDRDGLTGLLNHRAVENSSKAKISAVKRYKNYSLYFLFIDVDNFGKVNKEKGHQAGNHLLKGIAGIIEDSIRKSDIPGRWGGDEFLLILSEINLLGAKAAAKKIIDAVDGLSQKNNLGIGASIGISEFNSDSTHDPISAANKAMLEAKKAGKNRYQVHS